MNLSEKQIELLSSALKGNKESFDTLLKEEKDLAALGSALLGSVDSMNWLLAHNKLFALFVDAVDGNQSAAMVLMKKKEYILAAIANMLNEDDEAEEWLRRHAPHCYLELAEDIIMAQKKESAWDWGAYFKLYG